MHSYKVQQFGDLEHDFINPTDFAKGMNSMWWWECGLQGLHTVLSLLSIGHHPMAIKIFKFVLNAFYVAYLAFRTSSDTWRVDPAGVFKGDFMKNVKSGYLLALAYVSLCFFLNLYALRLAVGDEDA